MSLDNVGMPYSLPVMFHVFPIVGREEKTQQSRISDMAHINAMGNVKRGGLTACGGGKEKQQLITTIITS